MDIATLEFDSSHFARAVEVADLSSAEIPTCSEYIVLLGRQSEHAEELASPLRFLSLICSWRLKADDAQIPFESHWLPTAPESVTEMQLDCIAPAVQMIIDSDLRARLSDLLWFRRRCHKSARLAVEAYFVSSEQLLAIDQLVGVKERIRRALQIASQLGRNGDLFRQALKKVTLLAADTGTANAIAACVLELLGQYPETDVEQCYEITVGRINSIRTESANPLWERRFWEIAIRFARRCRDEKAERTASLAIAALFEQEAERASSNALAFANLQMSLHAYRQIADTQQDRERVHVRLLRALERMRSEAPLMQIEAIDLSDLVGAATRRIAGANLPVALAELVLATRWQARDEVQHQVEEKMKEFPLQHIFPSIQLGSTGKVASTAPGGMLQDDQTADDRVFAEMCRHYKYFISVVVWGTIEPTRTELLRHHVVTLDDVAHLLRHSPYVPHGREQFWMLGIYHGLHGRFIESLHLLVPQVEHLLRELMAADGMISSGFDKAGIQQEYDLNRILNDSRVDTLLGKDLCFVLRVIFIERFGYNLRNELAHGMLEPIAFSGEGAIYGWWLLLRLVAGPIAEIILAESGRLPHSANER